jgi:hypothetical protein
MGDLMTLLNGVVIFLSVSAICVAAYVIVKETETDTDRKNKND